MNTLKDALRFRLDQAKAFHGYANVPRLGWSRLVRTNQRIIDTVEDAGLRLVDIEANEYSCDGDDDMGGTFTPVVLALPSRRGKRRFLAGYETAWKDGGHFVDCSRVYSNLCEAAAAADAFTAREAALEPSREGLVD